jgi:pimeloyl-ACP methyl ester carboxylesterase
MPRDACLPLVLLLPGLDGTGKLLNEFVRHLGADVDSRIVRYPLDVPLGYEELEPLALAALPRDRPCVLLAESFSGPIAIRLAAQAPKGLVGVILCGSFARNPFPWLGWARPLAAYVPIKSLPRWVRAPLMWGAAAPRTAPARLERAIAGVSSAVIRRRIAALLAVDAGAALRQIRVPALVIKAGRDRVISAAATRWMVQALPGATLIEIDGPHLLLQTRPAECAAAVLQFLRGIASAP